MWYIPPKFFVAHPVSTGSVTFREFDIAYKYVLKKNEIEERNQELMRTFPNFRPEPLPKMPRFTGDENENKIHIIRIVEQFIKLNKLAQPDDSDEEEDIENHEIPQFRRGSDEGNESGYCSDSTIISIASDEPQIEILSDEPQSEIALTEEVEIILLFSFDDVCIHLINNMECDDTQCEAKHTFPSREFILNKLIDHSQEQINKAYELVLKSKVLKKKYLEVFNHFVMFG